MGATQYNRSHDRHEHRLTSPPAWHRCALVFQNNTWNNNKYLLLLASEQLTIFVSGLLTISIGQNLNHLWAIQSVRPLLCLCWKTYPRPQHNPIHFCFKHALTPYPPFPCLHCTNTGDSLTLNTNHGNHSVGQFFWCWEVDQTKGPEYSTANWWLHNVTACHNDNLNTFNKDAVAPMPWIEECPIWYVSQNCVTSGRDKALSHRSVSLWKRSPRVLWRVIVERGSTYNWICWHRQK